MMTLIVNLATNYSHAKYLPADQCLHVPTDLPVCPLLSGVAAPSDKPADPQPAASKPSAAAAQPLAAAKARGGRGGWRGRGREAGRGRGREAGRGRKLTNEECGKAGEAIVGSKYA
jgi:hypothetical protein